MSGKEEVLPLPELHESQQGTSTATAKNYTAAVSNAAGYLCHIQLDCTFDVPPELIFEIFCHPDNAGAFRDIKCVGYRKVKQQSPGLKLVEVEQCGELRVLWIHRVFRTYLDVTEDARDPECLRTEFTLLRSDLLSRFHGSWELRPVKDEASGKVVGCHAVLSQDVLPKGVPSFFAHLPVLGGLLRRVSLSTIQRLVEDILYIVKKYTSANGKLTIDDCIGKIAAERGHRTCPDENRQGSSGAEAGSSSDSNGASSSNNNSNADVVSFAIESFTESENEEEEAEEEQAEQVQQQRKQQQQRQGEGQGQQQHQHQQQEPAAATDAAAAVAAAAGGKVAEQQQQQPLPDADSPVPEVALGTRGSAAGLSADGEVLVAPAAAADAAASAAAAAAADGSNDSGTAVAAAAAAAVEASIKHRHHQGAHKRQQQQQQQQQERSEFVEPGSPAVGVLLDVSVRGHVHVGLIPNPQPEA